MNAQRDDPEGPENDWNRHPSILRTVIPYCFVACIMMSCLIVYDSGHQVPTLEIIGYFVTVFYGHLLDYTESSFSRCPSSQLFQRKSVGSESFCNS